MSELQGMEWKPPEGLPQVGFGSFLIERRRKGRLQNEPLGMAQLSTNGAITLRIKTFLVGHSSGGKKPGTKGVVLSGLIIPLRKGDHAQKGKVAEDNKQPGVIPRDDGNRTCACEPHEATTMRGRVSQPEGEQAGHKPQKGKP